MSDNDQEQALRTAGHKPIAVFHLCGVEATIWPWKSERGEDSYNVTVQCRYMDKEGRFHVSQNYDPMQTCALVKVADMAVHKMVELRAEKQRASVQR
jgi:hypothetical protein